MRAAALALNNADRAAWLKLSRRVHPPTHELAMTDPISGAAKLLPSPSQAPPRMKPRRLLEQLEYAAAGDCGPSCDRRLERESPNLQCNTFSAEPHCCTAAGAGAAASREVAGVSVSQLSTSPTKSLPSSKNSVKVWRTRFGFVRRAETATTTSAASSPREEPTISEPSSEPSSEPEMRV